MRIARHTLFTLARGLVTVPLILVIVGLILARLGPAALGVWAVLQFFSAPLLTFDFGITWSLARQVAAARDDRDKVERLVATSLALHLAPALVTVVAASFLARPAAAWLAGRSGLDEGTLVTVVVLTLASFLAQIAGLTAAGALNATERLPRVQVAVVAHQAVVALGTWLFVEGPDGLVRLFALTLGANLLQLVLLTSGLAAALGTAFPRRRPELELARVLLRGALAFLALEAFLNAFLVLDKWLLSWFSGSVAVGHYELAARMGLVFRSILSAAGIPLLAAASAASASADPEPRLAELTRAALRFGTLSIVPATIWVGLEAERILTMWAGSADPEVAQAMRLLVPSGLVSSLSLLMMNLVMGGGGLRLVMGLSALGVAAHLTLDFTALVLAPGLVWLTRASLAASGLTTLAMLGSQVRAGRADLARLAASVARAALSAGLAGLALAALSRPVAGRLAAGLELAASAVLFACAYGAGLVLSGELSPDERTQAAGLFRRAS